MLIFLALIAIFLPGMCWFIWFGRKDMDPLESLANIVGVSISVTAIFALLFFLVKIQLNLLALLLSSTVWIGLCVWGAIKKKDINLSWDWLAALAIFVGIVVWRLFQARTLVLPAWVDSLHHVLIVRKILESGVLPSDLSPYLQGPFYYHYAFHVFTAKFAVLSQLSPDQAVLILGQVLNAAIGLSVYAFGKAIFKDWRPAAIAGIFVSFLTLMPGYYLAWGRYTLTIGSLVLPLAMARAIRILEGERKYKDYVVMTVLTVGTLLAHYFTAILLAIYLVILSIGVLVNKRKAFKTVSKPLAYLTLSALAGFIVVLPWLWRVFTYSKLGFGVSVSLPGEMSGLINKQDQWQYLWYLLGSKAGHLLVFMSVPALVLVFLKPGKRVLGIWGLVLGLLALPWGLRIESVRPDHFAIVLFFPLALLAAALVVALIDLVERVSKRQWVGLILFVFVMSMSVVWGMWENREVINGKTIFANEADLKAIDWIKINTSEEARFYINTKTWGYEISRGVDGGAWILPLTGRWTIAPTLFYTFGQDQVQIQQIGEWGIQAQNIKGCTGPFWELIDEAKITHVYLKEGVGSLSSKALNGCANIEMVYEADDVSVWEMNSSTP